MLWRSSISAKSHTGQGRRISEGDLSLTGRIGEKYLEWSDQSPSLETILDIATLYWVTDTYASSIYTYRYVRVAGSCFSV